MCEFYEVAVSERETKGQRYANACAVVNSLYDLYACLRAYSIAKPEVDKPGIESNR